MDYENFIQSLRDARNRAQGQGRPLSPEEAQNATQPIFQQQGGQQLQSQALNTGFDRLAQERWRTMAMMNAANQASQNMLWQNLLKGGNPLAPMYYFNQPKLPDNGG
ncbi:MAG: hypothetical protein ACLQBQ_09530 [Smithella sp.]